MIDLPDDSARLLGHAENEMMNYASDVFELATAAQKWLARAVDAGGAYRWTPPGQEDPFELIEAARALRQFPPYFDRI